MSSINGEIYTSRIFERVEDRRRAKLLYFGRFLGAQRAGTTTGTARDKMGDLSD